MHKTNSPVQQDEITYVVLTNGTVDVWLRKNEVELQGTEDEPSGFESDEIFFKLTAEGVTKEEILEDKDFWFEQLADKEDGINADYLSVENYRAAKKMELSEACQYTIRSGIDIELSEGTEHFSLKDEDQINLFGKQAQLAAGAEKIEYHQDGALCHYYSAADMMKIIEDAMMFKSYHTTYANSINMWLKDCTKASEMATITYGATIPEEYQSEVLKDYMLKMGV